VKLDRVQYAKEKSRDQSLIALGRGPYFKRPVDGDDEESLEERRGRTMLRTAMWSTQANRYYGPPDGIQPEFDLLAGRQSNWRLATRYCIGHSRGRLQSKTFAIAAARQGE
jgi:hypothetical protein